MTTSLRIRFTLTEQDYVRAYYSLHLRERSTWWVLAGCGLLELCMLVGNVTGLAGTGWLSWALLVPVPLAILYIFAWTPFTIARKVRRRVSLPAEADWEVSDVGVRMKIGKVEAPADWGAFARLVETREFFFLSHAAGRNSYTLLPKRALASPQQQADFREMATRCISAANQGGRPASPPP